MSEAFPSAASEAIASAASEAFPSAASEACPSVAGRRQQKGTLLAASVAGRQWGVIGWRQLRDCGVSGSAARRWRAAGKLHVIHRAVFALGHPSVPIEGRLVAALLHAGPDAVLSHGTAAWWWGVLEDEPDVIHVSTLSRVRSVPGVNVHRRRHIERSRHRGFPVTSLPQTLRDYATTTSLNRVRKALANADYDRILDPEAVQATLGPGRPGSAKLRQALRRHQPLLARTRSPLEDDFIPLCESAGIPLPEVNVKLGRWKVDALWRNERLVVELDGGGNHRTPAQIERDRRKELYLRTLGLMVIRYTYDQVVTEPETVIDDLQATLAARRAA